jgi:hypothetical protein
MDSTAYGTRSPHRAKAAQIHRKTGNQRAVQLPLGHTKDREHRPLPQDRSLRTDTATVRCDPISEHSVRQGELVLTAP